MTDTTARFSPDTLKAITALQKTEKGPAWSRVAAYVIIAPNTQSDCQIATDGLSPVSYGKIKVAFPPDGAGKLQAWVWDCAGTDVQYGSAWGGGYDKLSAALAGLTFDGIKLTDHPQNWESQLREAGYTVIQAI